MPWAERLSVRHKVTKFLWLVYAEIEQKIDQQSDKQTNEKKNAPKSAVQHCNCSSCQIDHLFSVMLFHVKYGDRDNEFAALMCVCVCMFGITAFTFRLLHFLCYCWRQTIFFLLLLFSAYTFCFFSLCFTHRERERDTHSNLYIILVVGWMPFWIAFEMKMHINTKFMELDAIVIYTLAFTSFVKVEREREREE